MKKLMMAAMSMAVLSIVSCSKDLYDEGAVAEREAAEAAKSEANLLEEYKADFIKTYGEVKADQSWDFAIDNSTFYTGSQAATRAASTRGWGSFWSFWDYLFGNGYMTPSSQTQQSASTDPVSQDGGWYEVPTKTRNLMNTVFGEGNNNTQKLMEGTFIKLIVPENDFYILPIYMGQSGGDFKLCMHVDGVDNDFIVWSKWDNIQYKTTNNPNWTTLDKTHSRDGYNLVGVSDIRTKPIKISVADLPKNAKINFYLLITEQAGNYNHLGDKLGCVNGYIKEYAFNSDEVDMEGLPGYNAENGQIQCKFLGCEDASTSKTDKDFNDVVFLCYGQPRVPQSEKVQDLTMVKSKRYMIEDLGMANDKDFNDIVVDVIQTFEAQIKTYDDGTPLSGYENPDYQLKSTVAQVRALGGRLNFELKLGNTTWRKSDTFTDFTQMLGTTAPNLNAEPLHVIENVTGFDMDKNNIEVTVFNEGDKVARKVGFPDAGNIPLMIATPLSVIWSKEKVKFPFEVHEGSAN
jgi:hypothetical protein